MNKCDLSPVEIKFLLDFCSKNRSVVADNVSKHLLRGDYMEALKTSIDINAYSTATDFANDYFIINYLSKYKGFGHGNSVTTKSAALAGWISCEDSNRITNKRLFGDFRDNSRVGDIVYIASRKISSILGVCPRDILNLECIWSSGATVDLRYGTPLDKKISTTLTVTPNTFKLAKQAIENDPVWFESFTGIRPDGAYSIISRYFLKIVEGNRLVTVPKSYKTDRVICAEPTANAFLQQGIMRHMTRRLARHGIRIDDQSINQEYARLAYTHGLATVDLRNASDSLTYALALQLLPPDWFNLLDSTRSPVTMKDGHAIRVEKFCSMGNAFTFPLETLFFYALSYACSTVVYDEDGSIPFFNPSVYGDDIIISKEVYPLLVEVLAYCGFEVNTSKSYASGPFYESCGKHYFMGLDVTPVYQKEKVSSKQEHVRWFNRIIRWNLRVHGRYYTKGTRNIYTIDLDKDPRIPISSSDDGYIVPLGHLESQYDRNHGYYCRVLVYTTKLRYFRNDTAVYAYKLRFPQYSNACPRGQPKHNELNGRWIYRKRYIQVF